MLKKAKKFLILMLIAVFLMSYMSIAALASNTTISDAGGSGAASQAFTIKGKIASGSREIYEIFVAIIAPISVVFVAIAAFSIFVGGERGMEKAKPKLLIILFAIMLVYLAPLIVQQIAGWFQRGGDLW